MYLLLVMGSLSTLMERELRWVINQLQGISLNLSQDAKLALIRDERGNEAFTTNVNVAEEFKG